MIPILTFAIILLAAIVVMQELRLRRVSALLSTREQDASKKPADGNEYHMPIVALPSAEAAQARKLVELLFPVHSFHGISPGESAPEKVNAVIEVVPDDRVKFELDKTTGMLCVDRPQKYVNGCPVLYGFVPRSLCAELVGRHCMTRTGLTNIDGDGDPIDICVLTEKDISHGNILVRARPIGGLRMIDGNQADDKIIAVLENDLMFGKYTDVSQLDDVIIDRMKTYFETYKQPPGPQKRKVTIADVYGPDEAKSIIGYSLQDYRNHYGAPENRFEHLIQLLVSNMKTR